MQYAQIVILRKNSISDRLFTYRIPDYMKEKIAKGMFVLVPFGHSLFQIGLVFSVSDQEASNLDKMKFIWSGLEDSFYVDETLLQLAEDMRHDYMCSMGEALQVILASVKIIKPEFFRIFYCPHEKESIFGACFKEKGPKISLAYFEKSLKTNEKITEEELLRGFSEGILSCIFLNGKQKAYDIGRVSGVDYEACLADLPKNAHRQREVLSFFITKERMDMETKKHLLPAIRTLIEKGWLQKIDKITTEDRQEEKRHLLNPGQKKALQKIEKERSEGALFHYLHGVTGSGKTEIYMALLKTLKPGEQGILLVPEISLTPQMIERFRLRFGDCIAVIHSQLNHTQRHESWEKAFSEEARIIIGARSAIFAPCKNLKWIIIDEAHDGSYISHTNPKYDTISIAEKRAVLSGAGLLLGTATPTIEQYYWCSQGKYRYVHLKERAVFGASLPEIQVVDMRKELLANNVSFLSRAMYEALKETIQKKQQAIFFINRRGYAPFITCKSCGHTEICPHCDKSLTFHQPENKLVCHYCGYHKPVTLTCPNCGSQHYKFLGLGTQRVEKMLQQIVPHGKILRVDADMAQKKGALEKGLKAFSQGKYQILIGTQMITKGLDFKNVTLVGVLAADMGLNMPHYFAPERNFQLMLQVSGRAGRHDKKGKVILQTYQPQHEVIRAVSTNDYLSFYNGEIKMRETFEYPPFKNILQLIFLHPIREKAEKTALEMAKHFDAWLGIHGEAKDFIYPAGQSLSEKIKDQYRFQIIAKLSDVTFEKAKEFIYNRTQEIRKKDKKLSVSIHVNYNMTL